MAPEQARGKPADKRADMWAFGCVLYEMLTGVRAFSGEDMSETLAAVIRGEPDWRALTDETPAPIRRLLRRCLAKDPKGRLSDASMARLEIDEALSGPQLDIPAAQTTSRRKERFAWASALALVTAIAVAAIVWALRPAPPAGELRFEINTPPTTDPVSLAISPDGAEDCVRRHVGGPGHAVAASARFRHGGAIGWDRRCHGPVLVAGQPDRGVLYLD